MTNNYNWLIRGNPIIFTFVQSKSVVVSAIGWLMVPIEEEELSYFGPGPAKLPTKVLEKAAQDVVNWLDTGVSILEASHRSSEFTKLVDEAEVTLRRLLQIPPGYSVLFMQGGGTLQFAAVAMNLVTDTHKSVEYLISGEWSRKAAEEAKKLLSKGSEVKVNETDLFTNDIFLEPNEWNINNDAAFIYFCDNETIDGIEMPTSSFIPDILQGKGLQIPIICDMSSNFLSRPFNIDKFGLVFASAQKNAGPAGVTIVIVKNELLNNGNKLLPLPTMMDYSIMAKSKSLYHTPPTSAISVCKHVFDWIEETFGDLKGMEEYNVHKAKLIYSLIDESKGFYRNPAKRGEFRSSMNIIIHIYDVTTASRSEQLEEEFLKEAEQKGLLHLRGHRSVGGIRASLYNAITMGDVWKLHAFMKQFHSKQTASA